jgi:hypothetical protein
VRVIICRLLLLTKTANPKPSDSAADNNTKTASAIFVPSSSNEELNIHVFNGFFSQNACEELHYVVIDCSERSKDVSFVFFYKGTNDQI